MILGTLWQEPGVHAATRLLQELRPIDQAGLAIVGVFLVLGALRGLWWQVIRLFGLLAAGVLARCLAPRWSPPFEELSGLPALVSQGLVWFAVFVLGLAGASLFGLIGKKSLDTMQLGLADRFGGLLAGVLTGMLLHAAVLLGLSYLGPQPWTTDALSGTRSQTLLRLVSLRTPVLLDRESQAAREIRAWLGTEEHPPAEDVPGPVLEEGPPGLEPDSVDEPPAEVRPVEAHAPRQVR